MYKTLLNEFDNRQRELMMENIELKKVLQQMKREMMAVLNSMNICRREEKQSNPVDQVRLLYVMVHIKHYKLYRHVIVHRFQFAVWCAMFFLVYL